MIHTPLKFSIVPPPSGWLWQLPLNNFFIDRQIPKFGFTLGSAFSANFLVSDALECRYSCQEGDCKYWSYQGKLITQSLVKKSSLVVTGCEGPGCIPGSSNNCRHYNSDRDTFNEVSSRNPGAAWGTSINANHVGDDSDEGDNIYSVRDTSLFNIDLSEQTSDYF